MNEEQKMQINSALNNSGIQFALPQTVQPVWKTQRQVSSVQYDPNKLKALLEALKVKRPQMSRGELIGNALANMPEARSFTGGFGEEIINPWAAGLTNFARGFGSAYAAKKQAERERLEQEREDAIKAAQLENEANKQAITEEIAKDYIKFNDPNGKGAQEQAEREEAMAQVNMLEKQLEDIGTRYDDDFKNIDDMEKRLTKADKALVGAGFGIGRTAKEKQAERDLGAWKSSMQNVLVNANKKAGSGSMSDADAARYEQNISQAKDLPEARAILRSFKARMNAKPTQNTQPIVVDGYTIVQE